MLVKMPFVFLFGLQMSGTDAAFEKGLVVIVKDRTRFLPNLALYYFSDLGFRNEK